MFNFKKHKTLNLKEITQFVDKTHLSTWIWDVKKQDFVFISEQLMKQFELLTNRKLTKKEVSHFLDENIPHDLDFIIKKFDENQEFFYTYFIGLPNGETKWLDTKIVGIGERRKEIELVVGFVDERIDTEDTKRNNMLKSNEDHYTGLPNLAYGWEFFKKTIDRNAQKNTSLTLYKIVISNFSNILTTFGHEIANQVLLQTSKRLVQFMYNRGFLFHSYTDGWYAIIQRDEDVQQTARKMIEIVQEPLKIEQQRILLAANVGISLYPKDGTNVSDLMKNSTIAAFSAKEIGQGKEEFFIKNQDIKLLKQSQLASSVYYSVENNELYLEYQPKIDVKSLKVTGAEALIRWQHPVWGNVSPGEFIPIIEDMGLGEDVTFFVIHESIRQLQQWEKDSVTNPRVSLNLAPELLYNPYLYDVLKKTIENYNVSPKKLEIEIIEDTKLEYDDTIKNTIEKIKSLGIRLALDDMGDGFSSVYDLIHFKFDTLKIDRRAIDDLENSEDQEIIIKSLLDICNNLKIKSVVEGVERREQFDMLREMGCDEIQGFYFSPSVSAEEMKSWFNMEYAIPSSNPEEKRIERRKYFRVKLPQSLHAEMKILFIQEKEINLERNTEILIQNISPGGMKFYSYLQLPVNDSIVYGFEMKLMGADYSLVGKIVWGREFKKNIFEYGVEFIIDEKNRSELISSLFELSTVLRQNPSFTDDGFITEDPVLYLRKLTV